MLRLKKQWNLWDVVTGTGDTENRAQYLKYAVQLDLTAHSFQIWTNYDAPKVLLHRD